MGSWAFRGATPQVSDRNDKYGKNFGIVFKLAYTPSKFGSFTEIPKLEWKEVILMLNHHDGTYWKHEVDQYKRNPRSLTFISWIARYKNCYFAVRTGNTPATKFFNAQGGVIPRDSFPQGLDYQAAADCVRKYLKSHGGIMEILVNDTPAIGKPAMNEHIHKERTLTFDCGFKGMGPRTYAYQYLDVIGGQPENTWTRRCEVSSISAPMRIPPGYRMVPAPADVVEIKPFGSQQKGDYH